MGFSIWIIDVGITCFLPSIPAVQPYLRHSSSLSATVDEDDLPFTDMVLKFAEKVGLF